MEFKHIETGEVVEGKRLVVWVPKTIHDKLKAIAYSRGETLSDYVNEVLEYELEVHGAAKIVS